MGQRRGRGGFETTKTVIFERGEREMRVFALACQTAHLSQDGALFLYPDTNTSKVWVCAIVRFVHIIVVDLAAFALQV